MNSSAVSPPRDSSPPDSDLSEWTIEPRVGGARARARELWQYRRLLRFFASRALSKLYRNTILGRAWLLIRPLVPLLVKTLIFGNLLGVASDGVPYFLFLLVGTTGWDFFASSLTWATRSLELNRGLLGKVYVPRVILPISMMSPAAFNFAIYLGVLAVSVGVYYVLDGVVYVIPAPRLLWGLAAVILIAMFALGIGFFTSVLGATARDVRFTLTYVLDFWLFLTPVLYPLSAIPEDWRWLQIINPMAAFIETLKYGVLGIGSVHPRAFAVACGLAAATFVSGLVFFTRAEAGAVDRV